MRLDKYLKESGFGSRNQVKKIIKQKRVKLNDTLIINEDYNVDENNDQVLVDDKLIIYSKYIYIMLNKPAGVVSATTDNLHTTVCDLVEEYQYKNIFPIGRLDIDTEGLLILTNDGETAHNLLSPKKHVDKVYYVKTNYPLTTNDLKQIEQGVMIDGKLTLPAKIDVLSSLEYYLTIREGRFHQIKKMILSVGKEVSYLKRIKFGNIILDDNLVSGEYRLLSIDEINQLKK